MREFVAVAHPMFAFNASAFKQQALMFARVAIPTLSDVLSATHEDTKDIRSTLEWLKEVGIVFEPTARPKLKLSTPEYESTRDLLVEDGKSLIEFLFGLSVEELVSARTDEKKMAEVRKKLEVVRMESVLLAAVNEGNKLAENAKSLATNLTRLFSIELREVDHLDAHPILPDEFVSFESNNPATKHEVVRIALNALPIPDEKTPWEQIIEYRDDPASHDKFLDLRNWMSETARGVLTPQEVEEKLEYLLSRYRRHMEIHKLRSNTTMLQTIVITTADVLGNLASFQWGKAARALFSLKHRQVNLLEGELTAEGSEVAYLMKAREDFA